jgi:hypothetical protein
MEGENTYGYLCKMVLQHTLLIIPLIF